MELLNTKKGLLGAGLIVGIGLAILAALGNPSNMAMCAACFIRDMAGSLNLHTAAAVQYYRPEIVGLVVGSFLIALATKEFKSTGGSSPMVRFVLGFIMMLGALVFLGCPLRMVIRMAAGDLNAWIALIGFVAGVATGAAFLKAGYTLGQPQETGKAAGTVLPLLLILGLIVSLGFGIFAVSETGPGSFQAPAIVALVIALAVGAISQKTRICFGGAFRNIILLKNFDLLMPIVGLFIALVIYNVATGGFNLSFAGQPIAHSQHLWNILGLYAVGFAAVLAGGCPLRQMILAGQGSSDAAITFVGMLIGAAFAHNFGLASSAAAAATAETEAVLGGPAAAGQIALVVAIVILFVIALVNVQKNTAK